jgi:hypothetical protein
MEPWRLEQVLEMQLEDDLFLVKSILVIYPEFGTERGVPELL